MSRRFAVALFAFFLLCGLAARAHATPILAGTYTLSDVSASAGSTTYSLSGAVTIGSDGLLTGADVTLNDATLGNPVFTLVGSEGSGGYAPVSDFAYLSTASNTGQLYLSYLQVLDGSGNIDLCILSAGNCNSYQASYLQIYNASHFGYGLVDLNGGRMAETASTTANPTPEPGSFWLLGSGLLGAVVVARRRPAHRNRTSVPV